MTKKLDYLVVGGLGSLEWKHGSFGTKIEKAMQHKRAGVPLFIVRGYLGLSAWSLSAPVRRGIDRATSAARAAAPCISD